MESLKSAAIDDIEGTNLLDSLSNSIHTLNSCCINIERDNNNLLTDQLKFLQLAETLEKTAVEIRIYTHSISNGKLEKSWSQKKKIPRYISENIFPITLIWQLLCVTSLVILDSMEPHLEKQEKQFFLAGVIVMVIFQLTNLVMSLAVTVKLTKQYMHQTASMRFLFQSYAATVVLFAGMYTFVARVLPYSFEGIRGDKNNKTFVLKLFSQLLFTSISTGTLCGSSSVTAIHEVTELLMSFQMLLSFVYFASILSQVVNPSKKKSRKEIYDEMISRNINIIGNIEEEHEQRKKERKRYGSI